MQLAELFLLVLWTTASGFIALGCITNNPKLRVQVLFAIENRWGQLAVAIMMLAFVVIRITQWLSSTNPTINWSL